MSPPARPRRAASEAARARRAARADVGDADVVMAAAAAFLAVRPRSVAETRRRLRDLGYAPATCDEVTDRLVELGYLDDLAFARAWVESRDRARPRGALALRAELLRKGVPRDSIEEVLADRDELAAGLPSAIGAEEAPSADVEAARRLLERRGAGLRREADARRRRHKAYALLARHGFSPDVCAAVAAGFAAVGSEAAIEDV